MARSDEQARRNEATFREANEAIAQRRGELRTVDGRTPYLCECEEETCTEVVRLTLDQYRLVRSDPAQFVVARGHPTRGTPTGPDGDGWVCVTKR